MKGFLLAGAACLLFAAAESCGSPVAAESPGPPGPQGPAGVSGYEVVIEKRLFLPGGVGLTASVTCPATKVAISGGWYVDTSLITVVNSFPGTTPGEIPTSSNRNNWTFKAVNSGTSGASLDLYAVCVLAS